MGNRSFSVNGIDAYSRTMMSRMMAGLPSLETAAPLLAARRSLAACAGARGVRPLLGWPLVGLGMLLVGLWERWAACVGDWREGEGERGEGSRIEGAPPPAAARGAVRAHTCKAPRSCCAACNRHWWAVEVIDEARASILGANPLAVGGWGDGDGKRWQPLILEALDGACRPR
jgi:hypothetical protein